MSMRRGWRWLLLGLGFLGLCLGFALWRLSRDDERLTRWLADAVQSASGLQLHAPRAATFDFWPRLGIAMNDVELRSPGHGTVPARIGVLRAQLPWSSVFGRDLRIGAIELRDVDLDAQSIALWQQQRQEFGPLPAMRWPQLDAEVRLHNVRYRDHSGSDVTSSNWTIHDAHLDGWHIDQVASLSAAFSWDALAPGQFNLSLQCTPRQSRNSIAIEPCTAELRHDEENVISLRGYLRHDDIERNESQWRLESAQMPAWIPIGSLHFDPLPVDLALRVVGAWAGPLKVKLTGNISGSALDSDLVLPYGWLDQSLQGDWQPLLDKTSGFATIDQLKGEDFQAQGIEWRNEGSADSAISIVSPPTELQAP